MMTKAEKAQMAALQEALAIERAKNAPSYPVPSPMVRPSTGWINGYALGSDSIHKAWAVGHLSGRDRHRSASRWVAGSPDQGIPASQHSFPIYATPVEALRALRLRMTDECAKRLADMDRQIADAESAS